ncbi:MAG: hypothetical protein A2X08_10060 [Bacteroidetes bacterium GWA2_32_17]|nr:MAG: hypothetical protein A2X08_10060 [Bacteroidetes bacterium GWA2_32_17]
MIKIYRSKLFFVAVFFGLYSTVFGQTTSITINASGNWTCPPGVTSATIQCWGSGGAGGGVNNPGAQIAAGGGGSGGAYTSATIAVTPLTVYPVTVGTGGIGGTGNGGNGNVTWFNSDLTLLAVGGGGGSGATTTTPGAGALAVTSGNVGGTVNWYGGAGGTGTPNPNPTISGAGGGSANISADGTAGVAGVPGTGTATGGAGVTVASANGNAGGAPGAGGSGARRTTAGTRNGGTGGAGLIRITYATPPNITPFADLSFCGSTYPTPYQIVSFSLKERLADDFNLSQANRTIILTLPVGFEFNPVAAHTVTSNVGDITALALTSVTATAITITLSTDATPTIFDSINFNNFQIRAISIGSGNLLRLSSNPGTFLINLTTQNPLSSESFGFMFSNLNTVYDGSEVIQYTTDDINKNCESSSNAVILRIKVSVTGGCPPSLITQFNFKTNGDAGYSQNPLTNITSAKVYYNSSLEGAPVITSNTPIFGTFNNPNGAFTINGSQKLDMGTGDYYFFLVYDVPLTSIVGDGLDCSLDSFVMDGTNISNMLTPNPTGFRTIIDAVCYTPDEPNPPSNLELIPLGSYVIPMDNTNQALVLPFNLKAYGLVHSLLMNDIPVKWVILSGKLKDAVDFTADASRVYPTVIASAPLTCKASAFIIDSVWINNPFYGTGKSATQVITDYYALGAEYNQVTVYKLTNNENLNVRYTLHQRPKIAVFSNGGNQAIHQTMLNNAGLTNNVNYFIQNAGNFLGLAECYTFCSEAHWDFDTNPDVNPVQNVIKFVNEGGNFLAQCAGIDLYEDHQPGGGHFHTTAGINYSNVATTNTFSNHDMAFNQYEDVVTTDMGSTIRLFWPGISSVFLSKMYPCISAPLPTLNMVATAAHISANDSIGGNVFYLGGHNYSNDILIQHVNGVRMYMNATLVPSARPTAFTLDAGKDTTICLGQSTTLGGSPTGGSASTNYIWTPTTGLDNPNSANPVATPLATTTYTVIANDNGCPGGPSSVTVTINPLPAAPTAGSDSPVCEGVTLNLTASFIAGATYSWTGPNGFTSLVQNPSVANITLAGAGVYSVSATVDGCTGPAGTTTVTVNPIPSAPIAGNNGPLCEATTLNLTASFIAGATYNWTGPNGFSSSLQNPSVPGITLADAGDYSVTATVDGCTGTAGTTTVVVNPIPAAPIAGNNGPLCEGATLNLTASNIAGATYSWTGPNGFTSSLQNPAIVIVTLADAGNYSVTATVDGCTSIAGTTIVVVNPIPAAPIVGNNGPLCEGQTLNLTASDVIGATYSWTGPNGFSSSLQNPSIPNVTLAELGDYLVTVTVNGCTSM